MRGFPFGALELVPSPFVREGNVAAAPKGKRRMRIRCSVRNLFHAGAGKAVAACLLCVLPVFVLAASPVDVHSFPDAESERRYRALVNEFRCPKCLNVNISGSDAPIAQDLRAAVYRLAVLEGRSDTEVRDFLQARYGDFVLYDPPLKPGTLLLWLGPAAFLLLGIGVVARRLRHQRAAVLDAGDRRRLRAILDEE